MLDSQGPSISEISQAATFGLGCSVTVVKAEAAWQLTASGGRFQLGRLGCNEVPQALALPCLAEPVPTPGGSRSRSPGLLGGVACLLPMLWRCSPIAAAAVGAAALLRLPARQVLLQDLQSSGPAVMLLCVVTGQELS